MGLAVHLKRQTDLHEAPVAVKIKPMKTRQGSGHCDRDQGLRHARGAHKNE
jgi:hypothetical protein